MPGLSRHVRQYRLDRMQGLMRALGYDALAFAGAYWFEWASNHAVSALAWERPFLLLVTADGRSFALLSELSRNALAAEARRGTVWIDAAAHYAESPDSARHEWIATQWHDMIVATLRRAGLDGARIGADTVNDWLSAAASALPKTSISRVGAPLRSLRRIKHPGRLKRCATARR